MPSVFTSTGARVSPTKSPHPSISDAERDAATRNERAVALGIQTRYVAREED